MGNKRFVLKMPMKIKLCLFGALVILAFIMSGCDDGVSSGDKNSGTGENTGGDELLYIHAKIENASEYSDVVEVKFMVYDISINRHVELARSIWKNGGFTIELPKTLDSNFLHPLIRRDLLLGGRWIPGIAEMQPTLTINNENVRVDNNYFVGVNKDGWEVVSFIAFMKDEDDIVANFTYVDSDVIISGYTEQEFQVSPNRFERNTMTCSVSWKKGWNVWYLSRHQLATNNMFITKDQWLTTPINELKWLVTPIGTIKRSGRIYED